MKMIEKIAEMEITISELESSREDMRKARDDAQYNLSEMTRKIGHERERALALKAIISDLEKRLADAQGYARALNERLEHDSPVVEATQPVLTTKSTIVRREGGGHPMAPATEANWRDYTRGATRDGEHRTHWTAI